MIWKLNGLKVAGIGAAMLFALPALGAECIAPADPGGASCRLAERPARRAAPRRCKRENRRRKRGFQFAGAADTCGTFFLPASGIAILLREASLLIKSGTERHRRKSGEESKGPRFAGLWFFDATTMSWMTRTAGP